ncbi:MAG: AAA family ATPase [Alphaproteobacteria bacterium]|nr:AAA family ATPase [Alphaproteobacteria bacterium]
MTGEPLPPGRPGADADDRPRAASRFDAPDIATASLITILFADVVSSTTHIADLDIEEAQELLDSAVSRMRHRVRQYGGTVARVQGDGVMAIFGAPIAYEDHALRACCAAQAICEDFRSLPAGATADDHFRAVRVGVHSGRALIRTMKNDRGADYDAVGPDVNFAAKVEELASRNGAMLTGETLALAGPMVVASARGEFAVAPNRALRLHELTHIAFDRNLSSQLDHDGAAPLVGREAALQRILKTIDVGGATAGASIAIVGEAGIGKTRLAHEVARTVRALGLRVEEIAGISVLRHTPFASLKSFVRGLLGCGPTAAAPELRAVARVQGVPQHLQAGLLEVAGATVEDREWSALAAAQRREKMLAAVADLVERAAQRQPLLVLVEDVHHLDPETTDFLSVLYGLTSRARLWLLLTARAVARDNAARAATEVIELSALSAGEAKELCRFLWPSGTARDLGHVERVVQRAAGNPFFLAELLRMPGHEAQADDATPLGIASLVQSRMAALSQPARRVVQGASVLGDEIDRSILAATSGIAEDKLDAVLGELERQHLIDASNPVKIRFRHDLFRGGARLTLLKAEASEIHGRAARAFEAQANASAETLERLAYHAERSGQIEKALAQLVTACQLGVRTSSQKTIRALYDWAMRLKPSVPEAGRGALLDLVMTSLDALQQSGDAQEYERALQLAIELCEARGERFREGIARSHYAVFNWIWSRHDAARVHADIALKIAQETGVFALRDIAQSMKAHIEQATGHLDEAIATYTDLLAAYSPEDERSTMGRMFLPSVRCCAFLAVFLVDRGRFADAKVYVDRGERILGDSDQPYSRALISNAHGRVALATGDAEGAVKYLERAHETCLKNQIHLLEPAVTGLLASALVHTGKPEQARAIARYSVYNKLYFRAGRFAAVQVFRGLAEAELACGDCTAAIDTIEQAVAIATENNEPIHIAQTRYLRGLIRTSEDVCRLPGGIEDLEAALQMSEHLKLDPLTADCHTALATVAHRKGDIDAAQAHAAKADAIFERLGLRRTAAD